MALLTANTKYGTVRGIPSEKNKEHSVFRKIPFAKPPVGELRFAAPREPDCWEGELLCDQLPPACIQVIHGEKPFYELSEDCLYLNIFTPAGSRDEKLPVLFWIYGGGFNNGYGGEPEFDGEAVNQCGAILVTINYRCSVMGFFTLPELVEKNGFAGNAGLLDQIAALKWVQGNIEEFGGDPEKVLIFGQSAGGMSVRMLLTSPLTKGLFSRAVVESGGGLNEGDLVRSREEFTRLCQKSMEHVGWTFEDVMKRDACEVNETLNKAVREIADTHEVGYFQPFVDGYTLTEVPGVKVAEGDYMDIPIMVATVAGDSWMFTRKVREQLEGKTNYFRAFAYSPSQAWAQLQVEKGRSPIYTFFMDRKQPRQNHGYSHGLPPYGADTTHGTEVAYIFGTMARKNLPYTDSDYEVSHMLTRYWVNFAEYGNPNGGDISEGEGMDVEGKLPYWPPYTAETPFAMHVSDEGCKAENIILSEEEQHVLDYTKAHPGMLCSLEGFFEE